MEFIFSWIGQPRNVEHHRVVSWKKNSSETSITSRTENRLSKLLFRVFPYLCRDVSYRVDNLELLLKNVTEMRSSLPIISSLSKNSCVSCSSLYIFVRERIGVLFTRWTHLPLSLRTTCNFRGTLILLFPSSQIIKHIVNLSSTTFSVPLSIIYTWF